MKAVFLNFLLAAAAVGTVFAAPAATVSEPQEVIAEASKTAKTDPEARKLGYGTLCVSGSLNLLYKKYF